MASCFFFSSRRRHTRCSRDWSSDVCSSDLGQWVTYTTYPESTIWRSKADGSERLQLTFPPMNAHEPRWSPDGREIVFTDLPAKIFVVSVNGGTPRQLMPEDNPDFAGAATWSPDGNSIVFGRFIGTE